MPDRVPTLADLSLEQKVGQVVMGGFPDPAADPATLAAIRDGSLGNIILFARNCPDPQSVARLTRSLQDAAPIPLLIAADQEGGTVSRLTHGATIMPGAMALGATDDPDLAERVAGVMADEMRAVGINVVLAPVADVNANPLNPVIGVRAFGEDPGQVSRFVAAMTRGFQARGLAACLKHFPGHGDTSVDSHHALPRIDHSLAQMEQVGLVPFRAGIAAGVALVMTTHILFPALDPNHPSTLSRAILTGLLRDRLGFEGVVITDSMEMAGITQSRTPAQACLAAFAAGADIVCPSHEREDQAGAYRLILAAVQRGDIPRARLDAAVGRILALKRRLVADGGRRTPHYGGQAEDGGTQELSAVGSAAHWAVAREVAERAVTLVRDEQGWQRQPAGNTLVIEFGQPRFTLAEDAPVSGSVLAGALARYRPVTALTLSVDTSPEDAAQAIQAGSQADVIVLGTRAATLYTGQAEVVRAILKLGKPTVVVALRTPYDLLAFPDAPAYLCAYGDTPAPLAAAARVLVGDLAPQGTLPVSLPGLYPRGYGLRRHPRPT
ncbi:MAG: beta-N-acetylhexosaminidase [Anaerolineae bacterium]|nr:beta-N-acetylhexosaminidase [Anaerolineae bacterium]